VFDLFRIPSQCFLQESDNALQQAETFKYLKVVFTNDRERDVETDTWIDQANAVLRKLYGSVVAKRKLSNTAKLSVFKSVFFPIHTYGHESWVMIQ